MFWAILVSSQSLSTSFILVFLSRLMEAHGQAGFHLNQLGGVVGRKSIQLNSLQSVQLNNHQSVSTILMFTSVQKMNDLVVHLKVRVNS